MKLPISHAAIAAIACGLFYAAPTASANPGQAGVEYGIVPKPWTGSR